MSFFVSFIENEELGRKILRMKWQLWDFDREGNYLLLADQPCVFTGNIYDPSLIIALPIGPRKAFIASTSDRVASILRQQRPKDLLTHLNESSLFQAQVRVYALDAKPRRFICNRLSKRKRIDQDGRARGGALE